MNFVKEIIQQHINELDHEPREEFDGDVFYAVYPSIDWQAVEDEAFEKLSQHIEGETLEDYFHVVQTEIEALRDSQWFEDELEESRRSWHEDNLRRNDPYKYYGVSRHEFI